MAIILNDVMGKAWQKKGYMCNGLRWKLHKSMREREKVSERYSHWSYCFSIEFMHVHDHKVFSHSRSKSALDCPSNFNFIYRMKARPSFQNQSLINTCPNMYTVLRQERKKTKLKFLHELIHPLTTNTPSKIGEC